jgi:hypothetical protein
MSHVGPVATDSLERRGTPTSVSAGEPVPQPEANYADQNWDPGGHRIFIRDDHLYGAVVAYMNGVDDGPGEESRTDLDSHANMPVVGTSAHVLVDHNRTCEVSPYSPDYKPMNDPLVDAAVRYDRDRTVYILLIWNALYVPSLEHNLLPPLMMREAGVIVRETPKIQLDDPSEEDHEITFPQTGFRIPLSIWGVFSYFGTIKPTKDDLVEPDEVYLLTHTRWNPHTDAYAKNEDAMMDDVGNVKPPREREVRIVLDDVPEDEAMMSSLWVSTSQGAHIDVLMSNDPETEEPTTDAVYTFAEALSRKAE